MILEDVQADTAVGVDIWVVDSCAEGYFWWLERIVHWEVNVQEEEASGIRGVIRAGNGRLPVIVVAVVNWSSGASERRIIVKVLQFLQLADGYLLNSFQSHFLLSFLNILP